MGATGLKGKRQIQLSLYVFPPVSGTVYGWHQPVRLSAVRLTETAACRFVAENAPGILESFVSHPNPIVPKNPHNTFMWRTLYPNVAESKGTTWHILALPTVAKQRWSYTFEFLPRGAPAQEDSSVCTAPS